ncbi:MAG TPA: DNA polymerase ligase N-terminal domain-containing protein [Gaiellaceae bacterium]|jgi:bifunctional non-homologous end joining protein LigD
MESNSEQAAGHDPEQELSREPLRFVVQKHQSSHLHYDFRLQLDGVLKSWAIPKGPSLDPTDKRLAMMVDDHQFDYRNFEGAIAVGEYGGGTVMIWDEGTFVALNQTDREESEEAFREGLKRGQFAFVLAGQKLKGEFALIRFARAGETTWLLVKKSDSFASTEDVTEQDHSVRSGRSMEEIRSDSVD